jgi:hypothetical protein
MRLLTCILFIWQLVVSVLSVHCRSHNNPRRRLQNSQGLISTAPAVNVAFVFAGSARSFIHPAVHLSIKHNLIDAFCPSSSHIQQSHSAQGNNAISISSLCRPRVFVRLSVADNTHVGAGVNAIGKMVSMSSHEYEHTLNAAKKALRHIGHSNNPEDNIVDYVVVDIGSAQEKVDMDNLLLKAHTDTGIDDLKRETMHRIYRDLDPRRYNMYFNRWSAYQMAVQYEQSQSNSSSGSGSATPFRFDWVIHARLDFMWASPIRTHFLWSARKMWFPDHWATDTPDTFALLPRNRSDLYFSMDALYGDSKVGCLGGPNFDPSTIRNYASTHIVAYSKSIPSKDVNTLNQTVYDELCLQKFPNMDKITSDGIVWSWSGVSEITLRRKLEVNGITLGNGQLGYAALYIIMVRAFVKESTQSNAQTAYSIDLACHYAGIGSLIGWMHDYYLPDAAFPFLCSNLAAELRRVMNSPHQSPAQSPAVIDPLYNYGPNCDVPTFKSISVLSEEPMTACILDKAVTDWNFMPFRLRASMFKYTEESSQAQLQQQQQQYVYDCMTVDTDETDVGSQRGNVVSIQTCNDTSRQDGFKVGYYTQQLFHLYPLSPTPQVIAGGHEGKLCITVPDKALEALMEMKKTAHTNQQAGGGVGDTHSNPHVHVHMSHCFSREGDNSKPNMNQLFKVSIHDYEHAVDTKMVEPLDAVNEPVFHNPAHTPLSAGPKEGGSAHSRQSLQLQALAHKQHLPDVTVIEIRWLGANEEYCLSHKGSAHAHIHTGASQADLSDTKDSDSALFLIHCEKTHLHDHHHQRHHKSRLFNHFFIAERTINRSPLNYGKNQ